MNGREHAIVNRLAQFFVGVSGCRQRDVHGQHAVGDEPAIHRQYAHETERQQPGHDEQNDRQPDLEREQDGVTPEAAPIAGHRRRRGAQRGLDVAACGTGRGKHRDEQARQDRQRCGKRENAPVERDLVHPRQVNRRGSHERGERHPGHPDAERAADERQQELLEQRLADETAAARPERRPDRRLAEPSNRSRQRQAGEVGTRNQENGQDRGHQQQQAAARRADDVLRQRRQRCGERHWFERFLGSDGADLRLQDVELRARLLERDTRPEPSDRLVVVIADPADRRGAGAPGEGVDAQRNEGVHRGSQALAVRQPEVRRQDADHGVQPAVEDD